MRIGVGLPTTVPGANGDLLLRWAGRADAGPFSSVGVLDRPAHPSHDPFVSLAAAAAITRRVRLVTMVAIGPLRSAAVLAKQAASVNAISNGRLVLGLSIGARREDYDVAGMDHRGRGLRLSDQLPELRSLWEEGRWVPGQSEGPPVLVGGLSGASFARMARWADGYVHGGGPPRAFAAAAGRAWSAWTDMERPGRPELWAQGYFALGPPASIEEGASYLRDYYAFTGPFAEKVAAANLTTPQAV